MEVKNYESAEGNLLLELEEIKKLYTASGTQSNDLYSKSTVGMGGCFTILCC